MVYIFLADGFEDMEAVATFDILKRAGICVKTVGVTGRIVVSAHGLSVNADKTIDGSGYPDADAVVLPGGMPGASNLRKNAFVMKAVDTAFRGGKVIAAICAAPGVVLSGTGVLEGRRYTCYPGFETDEGEYTAAVTECDGNLVTANGPEAAMLFGKALVRILQDRGN